MENCNVKRTASHEKYDVRESVELSKKNSVQIKWILEVKENELDSASGFKARLVAKGFTQPHGVHFFDIFSPVLKYCTVRLFLEL